MKVVLEGEEETGGRSIAAYVRANPRQLAADCALILDTGMEARGVPTITYGLRGIITFEIVARGAAQDLHSGLYGGVAPNPIQALCWVLADLKGRDGHINLPGLYEMLRPVSDEERHMFQAQSAEQEQRLKAGSGLPELVGEQEYTSVERSTARPTFEGHGSEPVTVPLDSAAIRAAATALEDEFGQPVAFARSGGSIGIAAELHAVLRQPVVMMGFCLAEDNMHAPNEKMYLPNYYAAIRSVAGFLKHLAS